MTRPGGTRRLEDLGLGPDSSPQELGQAARERPDAAAAAIRALAEQETEAAAQELRGLETVLREKPLRREVRRALYRLRQKGVAVAEPETKPARSARKSVLATDANETEGYLSAPDAGGTRIFWIVKPRPGGGVWHMTATVNVRRGLREVLLGEITRKGLRSLRSEMAERHGLRMVNVPARYADHVISDGYETAKAREELTRDTALFPQMRAQLFQDVASSVPAPAAEAMDAETILQDPALLRDSVVLFEEPELERWALLEDALGSHAGKAREVLHSRIVVDDAVKRQQLQEVVREATEDLFGGQDRTGWQRLLDELAWFFLQTGRETSARRARASALALENGEPVPLLEELVRRSLALLWQEEERREHETRESSLLVTPDQIREARRHGGR